MRLTSHQALAARRILVAAGALLATLAAHATGSGPWHAGRVTPLTWLAVVLLATLVGSRSAAWRERSVAITAGLLAGVQLAAHLAFTLAPWLFDLTPHPHGGAVTAAALAAHAGATVLIAVLIHRAERVLTAALRVAAIVQELLRDGPCGSAPARLIRIASPQHPALRTRSAPRTRGPPLIGLVNAS